MKCPDPPLVENATYTISHAQHLGGNAELVNISSAVYYCKPGHEMVNANASTLLCTVDNESRVAAWEGEKPVCKEICSCPDPGVSVDGNRSGDCCLCGDTIHFSCGDQYELVGNGIIQCLRNGSWSSRRPLCRPLADYCEFPPPILHGRLVGRKSGEYFIPDEEAEIVCERGYKVEGNKYVVCETGGVWDDEFGVCKEILCDLPAPIEHGTIPELRETNLTFFPNDFQITYVCDEGYQISTADSWRICGKRGWSGRTPGCEVIQCSDPEVPENGWRTVGTRTLGSSVRFMCYPGYELLGSIERYCTPNGQWTGQLSRCNDPSNYCPNPGTPINGFKNMTEYKMGDKLRFRCQPGYILVGSEIRECLPDKTWSGTETKCIGRYDFDSETEVRDMLRAKLEEIREMQKKELQESEDCMHTMRPFWYWKPPRRTMLYFAFELLDSPASFKASIAFAKAVVKMVGISVRGARVGAVTFRSGSEIVFFPMEYNSTEAVLDALDRINHTDRIYRWWSSPLSVIREELIPLVNSWFGDEEIRSSVLFILSDGRSNFGGRPKWEADILKAEGVDIYCIGITGDVRRQILYDMASTSKYRKEIRPNVFILRDYRRLAWLTEEVTNETVDHSQCGLGSETIGINSGHTAGSIYQWPWMAALYETSRNSIPTTRYSFVCGGSIIYRQFVLTAAHCMYDKEGNERNSNETTVKLANGTNLQELKVQNIYVHPGYRNRTSMDYDIALLELENPIEYSPFVRPICLPPKEIPETSQFYRPRSIAWVLRSIGIHKESVPEFCEENRVAVSQHLKEIDLNIQQTEYCEESLRNHTLEAGFTERMFCATGGKYRTCGNHGGGPVMQSHMNKEGYLMWTQVGIDSGDAGCTIEDIFGFYPRLQQLMSWVYAVIENTPSQ